MWFLLILIGMAVGGIGSLIGAGGGFLLVPVLILGFHLQPALAAGTSLAMVVVNGVAASVSFYRQGRIDFVTGGVFAIASVPGAILGARLAPHVPEYWFRLAFGILLAAVAVHLALRQLRAQPSTAVASASGDTQGPRPAWHVIVRQLTDRHGSRHSYAYSVPAAFLIAFFTGVLSSVLGIGGGVVQVPAMVGLLGFPAHVATATSQVILFFTSVAGVATHASQGTVDFAYAIPLAVGALFGAPSGAWLSRRMNPRAIVMTLCASMLVVAGTLIF